MNNLQKEKIIQNFFDLVNSSQEMILSTTNNKTVSMRVVSPVLYNDSILFFTNNTSKKYQDLQVNPQCGVAIDGIFAHGECKFLGSTMLIENNLFKEAYEKKFQGAFDEGIEYGGRNSDFVIITVQSIYGWNYEKNPQTGTSYPTFPFRIEL